MSSNISKSNCDGDGDGDGVDSIQYFKLDTDGVSGVCTLAASIVVRLVDGTWKVNILDKLVPVTCKALSTLPLTIKTPSAVEDVIRTIDNAALCPGNPEVKYIEIYDKKGGEVKGERGNGDRVAFIDNTPVMTSSGEHCLRTIRRVDCDIICITSGHLPVPCESCKSFNITLRSALSRHRRYNSTNNTSVSSHSKYSTLTSEEKHQRMSNLRKSLISLKQHNCTVEAKIQALIEEESVHLQEEDQNDISSVIASVGDIVEERYPEES